MRTLNVHTCVPFICIYTHNAYCARAYAYYTHNAYFERAYMRTVYVQVYTTQAYYQLLAEAALTKEEALGFGQGLDVQIGGGTPPMCGT
jgi:hypothetical protein